MSFVDLSGLAERLFSTVVGWATSPPFYAQAAAIAIAVALASFAARELKGRIPLLNSEPAPGALLRLRQLVYACRDLLFATLTVLTLALAVQICDAAVGSSWLVRIAQSLAVVGGLYAAINRFIRNPLLKAAGFYFVIPVAALKVFGWLDDATVWLDGISLEAGNIRISLLALVRAAIFGSLLFWLGRISNDAGQNAIRKQEALDPPTRELFAKLFQITLFFGVFILLLQVMGLDLTALTVFGGALGVGIGFGLQQIAANFISGMIILIDRSLKIGDYIEMDDGKTGVVKELNMRSTTLATFEGKEIMVPNDKLITTSFTNWTRTDRLQRHDVPFHVRNDADIPAVAKFVGEAAAMHPGVSTRPNPPTCELMELGLEKSKMVVSFWVDGIEGGPEKVPSEVRMLVWKALRDLDKSTT